jgi:hypothetical protein
MQCADDYQSVVPSLVRHSEMLACLQLFLEYAGNRLDEPLPIGIADPELVLIGSPHRGARSLLQEARIVVREVFCTLRNWNSAPPGMILVY